MVDHVLALGDDTKLMILAPIVAGRKGEQHELFDELRAQGFVRVRIDGKTYEMDKLPKLDKNKKHTVEVVVDRLKVRADVKQRLAESFETALRHADGRALAVEMDTEKEHFVLRPLCLPSVQLLTIGIGAAPILIQQSDGRLPQVRRLGRDQFFRSEAGGGVSAFVARCGGNQGLGSA